MLSLFSIGIDLTVVCDGILASNTLNHDFFFAFICSGRFSALFAMDASQADPLKEVSLGTDMTTEEEYASQSKLLQEFNNICSIDKAWIFQSEKGMTA